MVLVFLQRCYYLPQLAMLFFIAILVPVPVMGKSLAMSYTMPIRGDDYDDLMTAVDDVLQCGFVDPKKLHVTHIRDRAIFVKH